MKIKFGAIVTDGRKKLGGHVFSKNRYGNYVRTNGIPTNPQTVFQQQQRARLAIFSEGWSGLTEEQRRTWDGAVDNFKRTDVFGDLKRPTGKNLYTRLNMQASLITNANIEEAPEPVDVGGFTNVAGTFSLAGTLNIQAQAFGGAVGKDYDVVIVATPPVTAGTSYVKNRYRVISGGDYTASDIVAGVDITQSYTQRFGVPYEGAKIFLGVYAVTSTGQRSVLATSEAIFVEA